VTHDTEGALNDALVAHLHADGAIGEDEMVVAWIVSYVTLLPDESDSTRQGSCGPAAQPYYVSHGLAAGLMATLNAGMGDGGGGEDE